MITLLNFIGLAVGVAILVKSADWFTEAAVDLARRFHIPEIVVGATIVSLATTLPEFAVSFAAALEGKVDMATGNAVGSTICNIGLILGLCAFISPMGVARKGFLRSGVALLLFAGLFGVMGFVFPDGTRLGGLLLLVVLAVYLVLTVKASGPELETGVPEQCMLTLKKTLLLFLAGAIGVAGGSKLMVYCAVNIATAMGLSELVISLTIVAIGTSTPELVVSLTGIIKKRRALSIGNIIGANILNLAWVLGACSLVHPLRVQHQTRIFDIPVMLTLSILLLVFGLTDQRLSRKEGAILFAIYLTHVLVTLFVFGSAAS